MFIHAFTGCDTVSSLYRQGKVGLFNKFSCDNEDLSSIFSVLLSVDVLQAEIIEAGLCLFKFVYGDINISLSEHRSIRYHKMTAKSALHPEALPPTEGAATQHVYRAYCLSAIP